MNNGTSDPDWTFWRSFEAVLAEGTLSGAARRLGLSQPTLGRHIDALEKMLGVTLFQRTLKGFAPTQTALALFEPVKTAHAALAEARARAEGRTESLAGSVRITGSTVFCSYVLPALLLPLRQDYPDIALEIVPSDTTENLLMREADIAIRMFRPTQLDLITQHIGDLPLTCCAHQTYLDHRGTPKTIDDLLHYDLIGFDRSDLLIRGARAMGAELSRTDFILRTDSQTLGWEMMKAGLGIGFAQRSLVMAVEGMVPLLPQLKIPPLEIWLTTHRELFTSRRIRAIYDKLAQQLASHAMAAKAMVPAAAVPAQNHESS